MMSMTSSAPGGTGMSHSTSAPIEEMLRSLSSDRLAVDGGDRAAHEPVARLADAFEAVGFHR